MPSSDRTQRKTPLDGGQLAKGRLLLRFLAAQELSYFSAAMIVGALGCVNHHDAP